MTKLKMGMIGGGIDSFIGSVHRMAAAMDGYIEPVCGALSSTPERSRKSVSNWVCLRREYTAILLR